MVIALTALFGLAVGSFANVVVDRLPARQTIRGRSRCDRCRRTLRWWELVPVVSALALGLRCPTCGGRITVRYAAVEIGVALLFLVILARHGGAVTIAGVLEAIALVVLGTLALIDLRERVVPDAVSVPALAIVGIGRLALTRDLWVLAAVAIGAGFFLVQRLLSRGRWVGDGDVRVGALMGALLPLPLLAVAFGASYIIGGAVAGALLAMHRARRGTHLPLVPFLFLGTLVAVFGGEVILRWYGVG